MPLRTLRPEVMSDILVVLNPQGLVEGDTQVLLVMEGMVDPTATTPPAVDQVTPIGLIPDHHLLRAALHILPLITGPVFLNLHLILLLLLRHQLYQHLLQRVSALANPFPVLVHHLVLGLGQGAQLVRGVDDVLRVEVLITTFTLNTDY